MPVMIGVISDTHWPTRVPGIQYDAIAAAFDGAAMILHAGDIETPDVLDRLRTIAPVEAVYGDDDQFDLPLRRVLDVAGRRIGLTHGQRPFHIEKRDRIPRLLGMKTDPWNGAFADLLRGFKDDAVDVIIFGHWHRRYSSIHEGVLLFNPGAVYAPTPDMLRWQMTQPQPLLRRLALPRWLRHAETLTPDRRPIPSIGRLYIHDDGRVTTDWVDLPRVM